MMRSLSIILFWTWAVVCVYFLVYAIGHWLYETMPEVPWALVFIVLGFAIIVFGRF